MPASQAGLGYGTLLQRAGVTLVETVKIGGPSQKADMKETTNMLSPSTYKEFIAGLREGGDVTIEGNYLPKEATNSQTTLRTDFENGTSASWAIIFPNALGTLTFTAFVSAISPAIPLDDRITYTATLKITGKPVLS